MKSSLEFMGAGKEQEQSSLERLFDQKKEQLADKLERWSRKEGAVEGFRDEMLKKYPELNIEMLSLLSDLAVEVNALHMDGYLDKKEAAFLLDKLRQSKGRDNLTTLSVMFLLGERMRTKKLDDAE